MVTKTILLVLLLMLVLVLGVGGGDAGRPGYLEPLWEKSRYVAVGRDGFPFIANLVANCTKVSKKCRDSAKDLNGTASLVKAYLRFELENFDCYKTSLGGCWDDTNHRWAQGSCKLNCDHGLQNLKDACEQAHGTLCYGHYSIGASGTLINFQTPTCAANACQNGDDMYHLNECIKQATCGKAPKEIVSACEVDLGCFSKHDLPLRLTFAGIFSVLAILFLTFVLTWTGIIRCCTSPPYDYGKGAKASKRLERESGSLREGLLGNESDRTPSSTNIGAGITPRSNISGSEGFLSPRMDPRNFGIVEGTPHPLNTASISGRQVFEMSEDQFNLETDETEGTGTGLNRPKFKLSSALEHHIIDGFRFRKRELQGKSAEGWGAGSTSSSSLVWRSLFYRQKGDLILRGVSGYIRPGMCVALIGAPDSGATTLLKVLARRALGGRATGEVLIDGYPPDDRLNRMLAYIPKEDVNLPMLTVRETLEFSFRCRSPQNIPNKLRRERVDVVLQLLGLAHVADTIVGDATARGISGGEKRRVSLGTELVVGRSLLLADSPTNGLDSGAAYDVIKASRALADTGLAAFMATIRQPSPELLALFDTCCLVSRGTCIYFGPTLEAEKYLQEQQFVRPPTKSLPDFLEEITGDAAQYWQQEQDVQTYDGGEGENSTEEARLTAKDDKPMLVRRESIARHFLVNAFRESRYYKSLGLAMWTELDSATANKERMEAEIEMAQLYDQNESKHRWIPEFCLDADGEMICTRYPYTTGFFFQLYICLIRQITITLRSPTMQVKLGRAIFNGLLIGSMFFQVPKNQQGAMGRFGLVFLSTSSVVFGAIAVIPELFSQRAVFYHQRSAGYFRPFAYHLSLLMVEIPLSTLETLIYSSIVYRMCGLTGGIQSWNFIYFWMTILNLQVASWSLCFLTIVISPSAVVAQAVCPTFIALYTLFCGYLVPRNQLLPSMRWLWDASPLSRAMKGLAINEVSDITYYCEDNELVPPLDRPELRKPPPEGYWGEAYQTCPIASGHLSLIAYDYDTGEQDKWVLFAQNLSFVIVFNILLIFAMEFISYDTDASDSASMLIAARKKEQKMSIRKGRVQDSTTTTTTTTTTTEDYYELSNNDEELENGRSDGKVPKVSGCIEFTNLNYSVDVPQGLFKKPIKKELLSEISGYAEPGTIVALMGPSGAGKSTLLDVLANKKTGGHVRYDSLLINGNPRDEFFPRFAGYVEQMDSHLPTQTVREAIEASARLRLPSAIGYVERQRRVEKVIKQLYLTAFQHEVIGSTGGAGDLSGVSPEVRKKVTIAVELVFDPALIFLDEPTTGLDSGSALAVMKSVREACNTKAVICTIHQPSKEVFDLFDWILLLQNGGRVAFFGPLNEMSSYFESQGFGVCPSNQNPADFALECTRRTVQTGQGRSKTAADLYEESNWKQQVLKNSPQYRVSAANALRGYAQPSPYESEYAASWWTQFRQLLRIQFLYIGRDTSLLKMRCATAIIFGIIIGILFFDSKLDVGGAQARIGLVFISVSYVGYSAMLTIPQTVDQRPVHFREYTSNQYKLLPYYAAIIFAEIPFIMLQNGCYIFTFYFLVGLRRDFKGFMLFNLGMLILNLACYGFSSFIAYLSPNADTATIINTVLNSVFTLFCGFLLPYKSIPLFWKPMYFISLFRYPLGFLVANEMRGRTFSCPNNERAIPVFVGGLTSDAPPPPFGTGMLNSSCVLEAIENFTSVLNNPYCFHFYCPITSGNDILAQYDFPLDDNAMYTNLLVLVGFYIGWRALALFTLKTVQHIRR